VLLAFAVIVAVPGAAAASPEAHGRWRGPLPGAVRVVARFTFDPAAPYARGARRGLDLRAAPGTPVVAPCAGPVRFAGPLPGRGRGVTLACVGGLRATMLGLGAVTVRRGARLRAGAPVGRLGARGVLRLGARRAGTRHGYVDPETLLTPPVPPSTAPPPATAPTERRAPAPPPRSPRAPPATAATERRAPEPQATPAAAPAAPTTAPWAALVGLGLLTAGVAGRTAAAARGRRATGSARSPAAHRYR
jgi:hypothetical protein